MRITAILCTYNRCNALASALESLARQTMPPDLEWEVLVVDNNSSDGTREVVERFCRAWPGHFRYLFEAQQGKSFALNSGIRAAAGEILAFVDDDVTVEANWLERLSAAFDTGDWAGVGGRIMPTWTSQPPRWLRMSGPYAMAGVLVSFDFGGQPRELTVAPFGTNMAFRRRVFERYGGFRTDLGPAPGSEIRAEDSEFCRRLFAAGERLRYEPDAIVYHPVPECRLKKKYFQAWFFDHGRARVREDGVSGELRCYRGVPRYLFPVLLQRAVRWLFAGPPHVRFYYKARTWQTAGEIVEAYRLREQAIQAAPREVIS
jgi:glycosyltransferase involved in cell wall biosynthesis